MKPKISLITLGVSNRERSTAFYKAGLGLPTFGNFPGITFFRLSGTWLALYPREDLAKDAHISPEGSGFGGIVLVHNVSSRSGVDAVLKEAEKAGAKIVKAALDTDWGGYSGYFSDPDGYLWEVAWNPDLHMT